MTTRDPVYSKTIERGCFGLAALGRWIIPVALACVVVITVGCAASPPPVSNAHTPTAVPSPTATIAPTATPVPTPVVITDLGAFRQKFGTAFTSGKWTDVQALLSPNFSFQPPFQTAQKLGSSHMFPPESLTNLKTSLAGGNPWSPGSDYDLSNHTCYTGNTPLSQVIGFDGNNGHYIMFGIEAWQGYWVATWGFEDSEGGWYNCIGPE
jgi:hypothetical protein